MTTKKQNYKDRKWQQGDAKQPKEGQKLKNKTAWYKVMQNQEKERESKGTGSVGAMQNNLIEQWDKYMHRKVK